MSKTYVVTQPATTGTNGVPGQTCKDTDGTPLTSQDGTMLPAATKSLPCNSTSCCDYALGLVGGWSRLGTASCPVDGSVPTQNWSRNINFGAVPSAVAAGCSISLNATTSTSAYCTSSILPTAGTCKNGSLPTTYQWNQLTGCTVPASPINPLSGTCNIAGTNTRTSIFWSYGPNACKLPPDNKYPISGTCPSSYPNWNTGIPGSEGSACWTPNPLQVKPINNPFAGISGIDSSGTTSSKYWMIAPNDTYTPPFSCPANYNPVRTVRQASLIKDKISSIRTTPSAVHINCSDTTTDYYQTYCIGTLGSSCDTSLNKCTSSSNFQYIEATCMQIPSTKPITLTCDSGYSPNLETNMCTPLTIVPGSLVCPVGYDPDSSTNSCIPQHLSINNITCPANYYTPDTTLHNSLGNLTGMCKPNQYNIGAPLT
jgi:hypothetical protein